jgi:hypothetical protein
MNLLRYHESNQSLLVVERMRDQCVEPAHRATILGFIQTINESADILVV